jgi:tetratricopeptide (TPR) repeat protein
MGVTLAQAMGNLPKALEFYEQTLRILKAALGPEHHAVGATLCNMGDLLRELERFPEAEKALLDALRIDRNTFGESSLDCAIDLYRLASLHVDTNDLATAETELSKASELVSNFVGQRHARMGIVLSVQGRLRLKQGRTEEAIAALQDAIAITKDASGPDNIALAEQYLNLGRALIIAGRTTEATAPLADAARIRSAILGAGHSKTKEATVTMNSIQI